MESWNCPSCTFRNVKEASACEICGLTSPALLSLFAQSEDNDMIIFHAAAPSAPARWLCLSCDVSNELQHVVCAVCSASPRESSKPLEDVPLKCVIDLTSQPSKQSIPSISSFSSAAASITALPPALTTTALTTTTLTTTTLTTTAPTTINTTCTNNNNNNTSSSVALPMNEPVDLTVSSDVSADFDTLLVEVLNMNCGFEVSDICEAIRKTGSVSAYAVVAYLNKAAESSNNHHQARDHNAAQLDCKDDDEDDETLNDFVLKEYIRDFAALVPNLLNQVDEFSVLMTSLGVKSSRDRSRAFDLLESIMREKEDNCLALFLTEDEEKSKPMKRLAPSELADWELAQRMDEMDCDNVLYQDYICSTCNQPRQQAVLLNNCSHCVCPSCIQKIVDREPTQPKCGECGIGMHVNDVRAACGRATAEKMAEAQTRGMVMAGGGVQCMALCGNVMSFHQNNLPRTPYVCLFCKALNCFQCNAIHTSQTCAQYAALVALKTALKPMLATDTPTAEQWAVLRTAFYGAQTAQLQAPELTVTTDMMKHAPLPPRPSSDFFKCWAPQKTSFHLEKVPQECLEYKTMSQRLTGGFRNIISCQRIQNPELWEKYQRYITRHPDSEEGYYWHGTRTSHPKVIYEKAGFDKKFSRVGNCLWFAVQSTYSMSGFQHVAGGQNLVILALVAHTKRNEDVKLIRGNQILNVYENSCTYPAYLVTYQ